MFESVFGNSGTKEMLSHRISEGKLPHALIIEGAAGSGKHTLAYALASARAGGDAGTEKRIREGHCPDVRLISAQEGRKTIGVETVRELSAEAYISSGEFDFRMFIVEGADTMTVPAQNAFLKLFEEPPRDVYFVLLCASAALLLPTVRSRAFTLRTERIPDEELLGYIRKTEAGRRLFREDEEALRRIAARADGVIGEALRLLGRAKGEEKAEAAASGIFSALMGRSECSVLLAFNKASGDRSFVLDVFDGVIRRMRSLLGGKLGEHSDFSEAELDALSKREICACIDTLCEGKSHIMQSGNLRLAMTATALNTAVIFN